MIDAFICDYTRTPIGRYGGALATIRTDDLAAVPIRALIARNAALDPACIDEVILGCANQAGEDNRNVARMAALLAGLPVAVAGTTVNRLCGSGMDAVINGARAIRTGEADLVIAGGVESMSRAPMVMPKATQAYDRAAEIYDTTIGWRFVNAAMEAQYGIDSMPQTAETVAAENAISRSAQDAFALRSQQNAARAQTSGRVAKEITPVTIFQRKGASLVVDQDEHPRSNTTLEMLGGLRPIVQADGTITAGNAAGINDGSAAMIIASEAAARKHGLTPIARIAGGASAGVAPRTMGLGPIPACTKLLERVGWSIADLSLIELNEAFASQCIACLRAFGIGDDDPRVNPNGGSIALGHPLGMSGARITGSAALDLTSGGKAFATMCVGVGQGVAVALEAI